MSDGGWRDYESRIRAYLADCRAAGAELEARGSRLDPRYNPTEAGCLKLVFCRTPAEAELIRQAYREVTSSSDEKGMT